ncbi:MAG: DUF4870 domain-containing protein [Actinomycetota bacterium]|nr:DUF4870 domain-containing protein [Actinomycetota bacterium]
MEAQHPPGASSPLPAPGWYPDPSQPGAQRWWDGTQWTQQAQARQAFVPQMRDADADVRQWAMFAHLSALLSALVAGLTFIGPLVIYLTKKNDHPFIADHAREALNFNLSFLIYAVALGIVAVLTFIFIIGFFLFFLYIPMALAGLILSIVAAVKANNGEVYRYPLTIRMVS